MLASQVIEDLQALIAKHGDQKVVSGLGRTGYGETVENIEFVSSNLKDSEGLPTTVFDFVSSEESSCAFDF